MTEPSIGLEGQTSGEGGIRAADAAIGGEQVGVPAPGDNPLGALKALDHETATVLVGFARAMYPHDRFPDTPYERVIAALDAKAGADEKLRTLLTEGVRYLATTTGRHPKDFRSLPEAEQVAALGRIDHTPFFKAVAAEVVVNLYSQPEVWKILGYEGPAPDGYLHNFDDIDWLDDAPDHRGRQVVGVSSSKRGDEQTVEES